MTSHGVLTLTHIAMGRLQTIAGSSTLQHQTTQPYSSPPQFHTPHRTLLAPRARLYASNTDTTPEEKALVKTEGTTALAQKPEENELALEEAEEDEDPYDDGDYRTPLHEKLLDTDDAPGAISISPQMAIRASLIELAKYVNHSAPHHSSPISKH